MEERPPVPTRPPGERPPVTARPRSVWANLRDVILRPTATFRDVALRPRWLPPLAVVTIMGLAVSLLAWPLVADAMREAVQDFGPDAPPGVEAFAMGAALFGAVAAPLFGIPLVTLVVAAALWGCARLTGARAARFESALAAVAYIASIPVLGNLSDVVSLLTLDSATIASGRLVSTPLGLGMLFDPGELAAPLHAALSHVNLFSLWSATLLAVAGVVALGMSKGWAAGVAAFVWVVTGLLQVAGAVLSTLGGGPALPGAPVPM